MLNFHKVVISLTEFTETLKHLFISILTYGLLIFFIFIYFIYLFFRENWNIGEMHVYNFLTVYL